jgi:hypothetical protein
MKRPPPPGTVALFRLSPTVAARVAHLPESDQTALADLVKKVGEAGLDRIINAFADGGRHSDYALRLPLLRMMAAEMVRQNPNLRPGIGGAWKRGMSTAAGKVAKSSEAKQVMQSIEATRKWLEREWTRDGRRHLAEYRAEQHAEKFTAATDRFSQWVVSLQQATTAVSPFIESTQTAD